MVMILSLFFTRGISLEVWLNQGLFDREKLIYEKHLIQGNLKKVYWLTYGSNDKKLVSLPELFGGSSNTPSNRVYWLSDSKIVFTNYVPSEKKFMIGKIDLNSPEPKYVFSFPCDSPNSTSLNKTGVSFFKK